MFKLEMRLEGYFQSWRLVLVGDDGGVGVGGQDSCGEPLQKSC